MFPLKILFAAFALFFLISCANEEKQKLSNSSKQKVEKKSTQQNFDEYYDAALTGDFKIIEEFVSKKLDIINLPNREGQTFLMLAAFNGHTELCDYLIKNGAHVEARDKSGRTALMYASTGPFVTTVKMLLDNGANVNSVGHAEKWTSLMNAAAEGQLEIVKLLLKYGADKNLKDVDGDTAESFALQKNHLEVLNFLKNYSK